MLKTTIQNVDPASYEISELGDVLLAWSPRESLRLEQLRVKMCSMKTIFLGEGSCRPNLCGIQMTCPPLRQPAQGRPYKPYSTGSHRHPSCEARVRDANARDLMLQISAKFVTRQILAAHLLAMPDKVQDKRAMQSHFKTPSLDQVAQ